jgi:hypothetical protein
MNEDVAINNVGSGAIAGTGTGSYPNSEPGVKKKKLSVILKDAQMLRRGTPKT